MPQNYFITGEPKAGKTTLIMGIISRLKANGLTVCGFISPEESHHGRRIAFKVVDIETRRPETLASVDGDGPKVSKYHVDIRAFESIAIPAMKSMGRCDVLVIDEIGMMEMKSQRFANLLDDALESDTPLIASLHEDYVGKYGAYGEVYELTHANRESIAREIIEKISTIRKKPAVARQKEERNEVGKATKAEIKKAPARKAQAKKPPQGKKEKPEKSQKKKGKEAKAPAKKERHEEPAPEAEEKPARKEGKRGIFGKIRDLIGI